MLFLGEGVKGDDEVEFSRRSAGCEPMLSVVERYSHVVA